MTAREPRIDIIRGFAIVTILLNHLTQVVEETGLRAWMIPTPTRYGHSTAAELFVIMSGYMVGLVYLARPRPVAAIWRRAGSLWLYNLALLALVLPLVVVMPGTEEKFWRLDPFLADPVGAFRNFALLGDAPRLLDVLQTYIKLMLIAPLAILLQRRSSVLLIAVSIGLYLIGQAWTIVRLAPSPAANTNEWLDLMSWQMLFFVPMALGVMRAHRPLFDWLERRRGVVAALLVTFVVGGIVYRLQRDGMLAEPEWFTGRYGLHALRVAHAVLVLMLYAGLLALAGNLLRSWPLRMVGMIGRHSLDCFSIGVVATYWLGTLWYRIGGGYPAYYLFAVISVALTVATAYWRDRRKLAPTATYGADAGRGAIA